MSFLVKNIFWRNQNVTRNFMKISSLKFHTTNKCLKAEDRKEMLASLPQKDMGTQGEKSVDLDALIQKRTDVFPDIDAPNKLFEGVPFNQIPIVNIKVSPNNTILNITDAKGIPQMIRSCGMEGFKNTRKGTNIAAQATAISLSSVRN